MNSSAFASTLSENLEPLYSFIDDEKIEMNMNNGQYISLTLNQHYVFNVKKIIESDQDLFLKDRGEAHITIFNPMEWAAIKNYVTSFDLEKFNQTQFHVLCLGRGVVKEKSTYFLVVQSRFLMNYREELIKKIEAKNKVHFDFTPYRPHITVGFTHDDLHYQDGVDKAVCWQ